MAADAEMKDAEGTKPDGEADNKKAEQSDQPSPATLEEVLASNLKLIEKAVATKEARLLIGRLLRQTATVRSQFSSENITSFIGNTLPADSPVTSLLTTTLSGGDQGMSLEDAEPAPPASTSTTTQPEREAYCAFLVCQLLVDAKDNDKLLQLTSALVPYLRARNRRTLDVLAARITFYYSLAYERAGRLADVRATLLELHCTAVLHHDEFGQEVLLNLLLRNYLHYSLYDQAEKLRAQSQRPETARSNQQQCRYLFYLGRIRAVQLEYSEAKECLLQATRKAPNVATGFLVIATKWLTVVRLLLGDIPERTDFQAKALQGPLQPYLALTAAVRSGDVNAFTAAAERHGATFARDGVRLLVSRLRYNVLRSGLRRISVAYSRISLQDVAAKLGLSSVHDAEAIVAKTIRDGSIQAVLDHEAQVLRSRAVQDVYITREPAQAFHARTAFCMDIHNDAVRAMRYDLPDDAKAPAKQEGTANLSDALAAALAEDDDDF